MGSFAESIKKVLTGSMKSFRDFPAAIACAVIFMLVTFVRIQLDWQDQEQYNFLLNTLQWSFAFGALFSLMIISGARSRIGTRGAFIGANIISILVSVLVFVGLYLVGFRTYEYGDLIRKDISSLAVTRLIVGMLISYLLFVVFTALASEEGNLPKALFLNHKAFFTALLYGLVILAGVSGVAGAFQALLYQDMTSKVYMYIATISAFIAFTIYVGYFPELRKGLKDSYDIEKSKQPRFIEILFGYIMVPIMIGLTLVLLLWTGRTLIDGTQVDFVQLSSIAAVYTIAGIWLHMMVSEHDSKLASVYKRFYPIAALIILAFEARALIARLSESGLKDSEYWFVLLWILSVSGAILIITLKSKAYMIIVGIVCAIALVSVLPLTGYYSLPVKSQARRLEKLLVAEGMFVDNTIVPASKEPSRKVREEITDAAEFLAYNTDGKLPAWFNEEITDSEAFRNVFGFDKTWHVDDSIIEDIEYKSMNLYLLPAYIDIREYDIAIDLGQRIEKGQEVVELETEFGTYKILLKGSYGEDIPSFEIHLNDELIVQADMIEFIERLISKYDFANTYSEKVPVDDMSMVVESDRIKVLLVFSSIEIYSSSEKEDFNYFVNLESIYIQEKDK